MNESFMGYELGTPCGLFLLYSAQKRNYNFKYEILIIINQ